MEVIMRDKTSIRSKTSTLRCGAVTLGQLGDVTNVNVVRRICRQLLLLAESSVDPVGNGVNFFEACHGLALLGKKDEALKELGQFVKRNSAKWHPSVREMYQRDLDQAKTLW